ncbi:MAG: amino acid ABC transporter permease [Clostridia bacterium]|nr:amino acid ABC transporter permease [Clostridia bacterium]MBQ8973364.1 amino acid ABC transporter permease [Clostridia bacterium]
MPNAQSGFFEWVWFIFRTYAPMFLSGAGTTLLLALSGTFVGFIIGLAVGVVRTIQCRRADGLARYLLLKIVRGILAAYIEIFRSTPMIVQAMVIFYGSAQLFGITLPYMLAGFIIVSINTGAYLAEIMRGGIQSVDPGQQEAASAIGMTHGQTMLYVVLPQAIRNILPALGNEFVVNIKDTSVLNVISVSELFFVSKTASGTFYRYFETFFITSVIYFVMTFACTRLLRVLEKRMDGPENYTIHGSQTAPEGELKLKGGSAQ